MHTFLIPIRYANSTSPFTLYDLKQVNRQWYSKFFLALTSLGYTQSQTKHSLYIKLESINFTGILVYIDDIALVDNCMTKINNVKMFHEQPFYIKDLEKLRFFLA